MMKRSLLLLVVFAGASCTGEMGETEIPENTPGAQKPGPIGGSTTGPTGPTGPGVTPGPSTTPVAPAPYEPLPPRVYAAKVKDLLTGLPLSNEELQAVTADPKVLRRLIDTWMALPQFRDRMFDFLKSAFQQTQLDTSDLDEQFRLASVGASSTDQRKMLKSVEESFVRTVLHLIDQNRPFTEAVTTTKFMMNVPMMVALAYMDAAPRDDKGNSVTAGYWLLQKFGRTFKFEYTTNTDPNTGEMVSIPLEQSIDPNHPNFMRWNFKQPDPNRYPNPCKDPTVITGTSAVNAVFRAMFGSRQACNGTPSFPSIFTDEDWNTWRLVTVRAPKDGEERTLFWDVPKLRDPNTTELVLATPRVGFMTTPAFFANWPTNPSNSYRVTINQALIVGLGKSFDDRGTTVQVAETSVDDKHIEPGTACFGCHQTLDPMRDFYRQTYSITYFQQLGRVADPKMPPLPTEATFAVDGAPAVRGSGILSLAKAMAEHPLFAVAWTQKFCHFANATPCSEDDPEFKRVATAFRQSRHDFKTLVRELFSSPLVTFAAKTKTAEEHGVVMSIARRETFCTRLSNRLGVKDVCNRVGESGLPRIASQVKNLSLGIPGSAYSRADEHPVMPHDPNLFFVEGSEKICGAIAGQLVEASTTSPWRVAQKDAAITDFVQVIMGVPSADPRHAPLRDVLARHYDAAVAAKERPADALRSTFTLACASPLGVSSGL